MNARLRQMERVRHLRVLMERRSEAELVRACGRQRVVEAWMDDERETVGELGQMARDAMADGECIARTLAEGLLDVSAGMVARLKKLEVSAASAVELSQEALRERRREAEQAKLLVDSARVELAREQERREQTARDDRFAARQDWMRRRASLKVG